LHSSKKLENQSKPVPTPKTIFLHGTVSVPPRDYFSTVKDFQFFQQTNLAELYTLACRGYFCEGGVINRFSSWGVVSISNLGGNEGG
jgi:hypothetical protein